MILLLTQENILATRSPKFRDLIAEDPQADIISLSEWDEETIHCLLQWIYTGRCSMNEPKKLIEAASYFQLSGLFNECQRVITAMLSDDSVLETVVKAFEHKWDVVLQSCFKLLSEHHDYFRTQSAFQDLPREILLSFISYVCQQKR